MTINYKIEMLTDWHVGSGLDSGSDVNALVLKDEDNIPYIPGKTIKGLLKDALKDINEVQGEIIPQEIINNTFGYVIKKDNNDDRTNNDESDRTIPGTAFFSNAKPGETERKEIIANELVNFLYRNIASTSIENNGIAKKNSLRVMQVCVPLTIEGYISDVKDNDMFEKAFKWLRHLGVNRNRGLGRCKCSIIDSPENQTL